MPQPVPDDEQNRLPQMTPHKSRMKDRTLEQERFYKHSKIDPKRLLRVRACMLYEVPGPIENCEELFLGLRGIVWVISRTFGHAGIVTARAACR